MRRRWPSTAGVVEKVRVDVVLMMLLGVLVGNARRDVRVVRVRRDPVDGRVCAAGERERVERARVSDGVGAGEREGRDCGRVCRRVEKAL